MSLTKYSSKVIAAVFFVFFIGYMFVVNADLIKNPVIKFVRGTNDFRKTTNIIATNYASKRLKYRNAFINLNGFFARLTGRRVCNEVLLLKGNVLTFAKSTSRLDQLGDPIEKTVKLAEFSKSLNIPFIYVVAPYKVPISQDNIPVGTDIFANENTDIFKKKLSEANVDSLDLRPLLSTTSEQVNKYFYRTDHHWNPDGAFLAFQSIMKKIETLHLKERKFDKKYTNINLWKRHEKKNWMLGSHGKRVGTLFAGTDSLIYYTPRFITRMSLTVPHHKKIYKGDFFATNIRKKYIDNKDYFNYNAYCVYIGGDYPLVHHRNINAPNKMKVLVLKDSFVLPLQAFMSTEFSELDVIDPRHYKASTIAEYILWTKPDLVLMVRNAGSTGSAFGLNNYINDKVYSKQTDEVLLKDYNISLVASKVNNRYKKIPVKLHAGNTYSVSFKDIIVTHGKTDGVSVALYNPRKKKIINHEIFDIEYNKKSKKNSRWVFRIPQDESDCSLLVYSGIHRKTKNIGVKYSGINVHLLY